MICHLISSCACKVINECLPPTPPFYNWNYFTTNNSIDIMLHKYHPFFYFQFYSRMYLIYTNFKHIQI